MIPVQIIKLNVSLFVCVTNSCEGKEKFEVGKTRSITNNPCKKAGATETFGKLITNAKGDPYVDPGNFNKSLRGSSSRPQTAKPSFKMSFPSARKVKHSEFEHFDGKDPHGSYSLNPFVQKQSGFYNRKSTQPFTSLNGIGYNEDPYERQQDQEREEYAKQNDRIMYKN